MAELDDSDLHVEFCVDVEIVKTTEPFPDLFHWDIDEFVHIVIVSGFFFNNFDISLACGYQNLL